MTKPKTNNNQNNEEIKINKQEQSGLAEFINRPVATDKELEDFEEFVSSAVETPTEEEEAREEEVEESLSEIYQDGNGGMIDVKKMDIKKKRGFFFWFFTAIFISAVLAGAGYAAYYYLQKGSDPTNIAFSIEGKKEARAGEEFFYAVNYKNPADSGVNNVKIKIMYPDNFIFIDSSPIANGENGVWQIDSLPARSSGQIKIKGKIIGPAEAASVILAAMAYTPANFSSEFKKEASFTTTVKDIGINLDFDYNSSALVNKENEIILKFSAKENNYLNNFRLTVDQLENMEFIPAKNNENNEINPVRKGEAPSENKEAGLSNGVKLIKPGVWEINAITEKEQKIAIKFKLVKKIADTQEIKLYCEGENAGQYYKFFEKNINYEIMQSDLNLTLIINGSRNDQAVDFGQTLNYSIAYANKGAAKMKDVIIMAVLESGFLDWDSLKDGAGGKKSNNTLSWSKEEIPELEVLEKNEEGIIDFSVNLARPDEITPGKDYQVKSYAQFALGRNNGDISAENQDNRGNTIINKINSDLKLSEQIRYFNDDNIAVGTGLLPPKVGEATSFKVYWVLTNNLHELKDLRVETTLPDYISWGGKNRASAGAVNYDSETRKVTWQIGRLPITVYKLDAEFNISLVPSEAQKNQIVVLLPGSEARAVDAETEAAISKSSKAKTTKLEDDEIANMSSDGRVE
ncbi:MAG: hypothetical protein Q8N21_04310 [bacterium]|nr:hypothetical protein [bacterium]